VSAALAKPKRVQQPDNPAAPTLTRDGYYTAPPLKLLRRLGDEQLAALERFVVGREDYGEVQFLQASKHNIGEAS
jgi:Nucleoporin autopeptidase